MTEPTLVILAAGLASRYGGLKQMDPVGDNGESLIDFSIYDAYLAGFRKLVLIVRKEHEELFEQQIGINIRPFMEVCYAYQSNKDLPEGFSCPKERFKPWGTTHALLTTEPYIDGPFAIINSDDYYGREAFEIMYRFLKEEITDDCFGMIGYPLDHTLTDNGPVTRGICKQKDGYLTDLYELKGVYHKDDKIYYKDQNGQDKQVADSLVSMNFWGFNSSIYAYAKKQFQEFLKNTTDLINSELVLSTAMSNIIQNENIRVKVLQTNSQWFGVTYPADKEAVKIQLAKFKAEDYYPFDLWD